MLRPWPHLAVTANMPSERPRCSNIDFAGMVLPAAELGRGAAPCDAERLRRWRQPEAWRCRGARSFPRRRQRAVDIDRAAGVLDDGHGKVLSARVLGRVAYAEVQCEPGDKDAPETTLAQIPASPVGVLRSFSYRAE